MTSLTHPRLLTARISFLLRHLSRASEAVRDLQPEKEESDIHNNGHHYDHDRCFYVGDTKNSSTPSTGGSYFMLGNDGRVYEQHYQFNSNGKRSLPSYDCVSDEDFVRRVLGSPQDSGSHSRIIRESLKNLVTRAKEGARR